MIISLRKFKTYKYDAAPFFFFIDINDLFEFGGGQDPSAKRNTAAGGAGLSAGNGQGDFFGIAFGQSFDDFIFIFRDIDSVGMPAGEVWAVFEVAFDDVGVGFL